MTSLLLRTASRLVSAVPSLSSVTSVRSVVISFTRSRKDTPLDENTVGAGAGAGAAPPGMAKFELLAKQAGNDNPFDTYILKPEVGQGDTAGFPILIPSSEDTRLVGCCCEDDYAEVVWFELRKGEDSQKCDCGLHFRLVDHDPLDPGIKPKFGGGFGSGLSTVYY